MSSNISNEIIARRDAQALADRLARAMQLVNAWHLSFETQVVPSFADHGRYDVQVTGRVGDKVYNRLLSSVDVEYFSGDAATITRLLAQSFIMELLLDRATEDLGIQLAPAIANAAKLNGRGAA